MTRLNFANFTFDSGDKLLIIQQNGDCYELVVSHDEGKATDLTDWGFLVNSDAVVPNGRMVILNPGQSAIRIDNLRPVALEEIEEGDLVVARSSTGGEIAQFKIEEIDGEPGDPMSFASEDGIYFYEDEILGLR